MSRRVGVDYQAAVRRLASDANTVEAVTALRADGIRPLLVKGPVLERWLYTDGTERRWNDIDLVVKADRFAEAERALSKIGYRMSWAGVTHDGMVEHEHLWVRGAAQIDLHRGFWGLHANGGTVWHALADRTEQLKIGGGDIEVPAVPVTALMVAVHVAQHGQTEKPREDLRRAIACWDDDVWREAARIAVRVDAQSAFAMGLEMLEPGRELRRRLGLELITSAEERLRAQGHVPLAMGFHRLANAPTHRARMILLIGELLPNPRFMRWRYGLAQRGRTGLAAAYLVRVLTLCTQAPKGWLAWRKARRSGSESEAGDSA